MKASIYFENIINQSQVAMQECDAEGDVKIQPENVLVFYRNQYQSSATITITRQPNCKEPIKFQLKTTNKASYLVSSSVGTMPETQNRRYIDILINKNTPLQQCLLDRFKLCILIQGKSPKQKKFKVIIDYKKDCSKIKEKDYNGLQVTSKVSGSISTAATTTILGSSLAISRKNLVKHSKLISSLTKGGESEGTNFKQQLDQVIKQVEDRRLRLQLLQQQILKNSYRKKFGCYITILLVFISFLVGISCRGLIRSGLIYYNQNL